MQALPTSLSGSGVGGGSLSSLPHILHPSHQPHLRSSPNTAGLRHDQHHVGGHGGVAGGHGGVAGGHGGGATVQQGSPLLHVDGMHQMDALPPGPSQLATPTQQQMEKSVTHMDQLANDRGGGLITPANTASPPNHIRNMLLSQHHQQSSKGTVITGTNPMLMSHGSPAPPPAAPTPPTHASVHTPPMGGAGELHPALSSRGDHSHPSNSGAAMLQQQQPPMSPVTPPPAPDNPTSIHTYGGWSYPHPQHAAVLLGNESYAHGLPLLPTMQANTPTTQNHAFFKANF